MSTTRSTPSTKLAQLVAKALAERWCGSGPAAGPVRAACTEIFTAIFLRADSATRGATAVQFARLLQEYLKRNPAPNADRSGQTSSEDAAAGEMAAALLAFIPAEYRSLDSVLSAFHAKQQSPDVDPETPAPQPSASDDIFGSSNLKDEFFSGGELAAVWPNRDDLAREILEKLKNIRAKFPCGEAATDIAFWAKEVPLRAASSFGVAGAIQAAFAGLAQPDVTGSNLRLGNGVHAHVEQAAALALAPQLDRYLVAENWVHLPGGGRVNLGTQSALNRQRKEFSLMCLINARRQMDDVVRSKGSATSREDLIIFYKEDAGWIPAIVGDGRPQVYEIKPVDSLLQAVSQVTSYSLNYLTASVRLRCTYLPTQPLARLDNSLMLPGAPETRSFPIPDLTITGIVSVAALGAAPPIAAAKLAQLVSTFTSAAFVSPPLLAVPFMVSGLYGVIPYFVLKLGPNAQAVLQAVLESLIAAILAYLSAQKAFEEILGEVATALGELLPVLAAFLCLVIVLFFTWPLILAILEAASAGVVVALAAALVVVIVTELNKKPGVPQKVDPNNTPLAINLGPLSIQGITAVQISAFSRALDQGLQTFFRQGPLTKTGDSAVPSV